jgi:hypothetical protein
MAANAVALVTPKQKCMLPALVSERSGQRLSQWPHVKSIMSAWRVERVDGLGACYEGAANQKSQILSAQFVVLNSSTTPGRLSMDRLRPFVEALRRLAQTNDPNRVVLIEETVREYLKSEPGTLRLSLEGFATPSTAKRPRSVEARIGA